MKQLVLFAMLATLSLPGLADRGKLLATPGVTQFEGAGGGGIVPWAMLSGYASQDEIAVSGFATSLTVDDLSLAVLGAAFNFHDRIELSVAQQTLDVKPASFKVKQDVYGVKVRLYGDVVYSQWPQVSLGVQHKVLKTPLVILNNGTDSGTDIYFAASKLHLGAMFGYNLLWNVTARGTRAIETGLLGFGGTDNGYKLQLESSVAVLFGRHLAVGVEYRSKPNAIGVEEDWRDVFVAFIPNKRVNVTAAYADLGTVAGFAPQRGFYISLTGYLK